MQHLHDIDWVNFFKVQKALSTQLNKPSQRFLKSQIIDSTISKLSRASYFKYVDEVGYDLIGRNGEKIEIKVFGTLKHSRSKAKIDLRLHNTYSNSAASTYKCDTFDYLLVVGHNSAAYTTSNFCANHLSHKKDCIVTTLRHNQLNWIVEDAESLLSTHSSPAPPITLDVEKLLQQFITDLVSKILLK